MLVFGSAFFAIFPAMFCTVIPFAIFSIVFNAMWELREQNIYIANAGKLFTADMAKAEMAKQYPSMYRYKYTLAPIILTASIGILWILAFTLIYSSISYLPIFLHP